MGKIIDETGNTYGRLKVVEIAKKDQFAYWLCKCSCENWSIVKGRDLRLKKTKSCGCLSKEQSNKICGWNKTHGESKNNPRLYRIWKAMRNRCNNKNNPSFHRYGGRGIKVCKEWDEYEAFKNWAIDNDYGDGLSIDRINNNGNYTPDNCKWSTPLEQANNTRQNKNLTFRGKTKTLSEWARELNLNYDALKKRILEGWDTERALTTPICQNSSQHT